MKSAHGFVDPRAGPRREITVYTYRPSSYTPESRIVLVMHGRARNGAEYRDWFSGEAERRGFLLAVPEFSEAHYAHPYDYNYGAMVDAEGRCRPRAQWLWPVVDAIFEDVRRRFGSRQERYSLFGHSAGGQVVHRLATFAWSPRIERAIAANSGHYTMPLMDEAFPHGMGGTGLGDDDLRALFSRPLVILLGTADTDPDHPQLPRDPPDMRQGPHRFARGQRYFDIARREAARLGVPFGWRIAAAPGVAHVAADVAPHAAPLLFESGEGPLVPSPGTRDLSPV
jgi:poly(3-hydroxybutyrate) depolymerase